MTHSHKRGVARTATCAVCGKPFDTTRSRARYCSRKRCKRAELNQRIAQRAANPKRRTRGQALLERETARSEEQERLHRARIMAEIFAPPLPDVPIRHYIGG